VQAALKHFEAAVAITIEPIDDNRSQNRAKFEEHVAEHVAPSLRKFLEGAHPDDVVDPVALARDISAMYLQGGRPTEHLPLFLHDFMRDIGFQKRGGDWIKGSEFRQQVLSVKRALSTTACSRLRVVAEALSGTEMAPDSVDGLPTYQIALDKARLEALIGSTELAALFALPGKVDPSITTAYINNTAQSVAIFLRKYSPDTRPWIGYHFDVNNATVNVALDADTTFEGGRLVGFEDSKLRVYERSPGEATVHTKEFFHGVTKLKSGSRFSLILFFGPGEDYIF
jgi:hypothetical protein